MHINILKEKIVKTLTLNLIEFKTGLSKLIFYSIRNNALLIIIANFFASFMIIFILVLITENSTGNIAS